MCIKWEKSYAVPVNSSPENSADNVIDPNCDCNVELELSVPNEPVSVSRRNDPQDAETDMSVQSLSKLPIVNSVNNVIDPNCDCNVELELSVPNEPISNADICVKGKRTLFKL